MFEKLFERSIHLTKKGGMDLTQTSLKLSEEVGELCRAVLLSTKPAAGSYRYDEGTPEAISEEAADVMLVAMSVIFLNGTTPKQLWQMVEKKMDKWESKINE
jgi:NTP pyrophosphatase (non-canonical NTP hydrolase)